uniref:Uncharacterized protein n=1 Tax=Candidatus Kentrum eta TaxID=2126337 RepID=A0A450VF96_9GAMM|nr:MAG: hypothetical protein BECKH772A_GA0070896_103301 [Candidatus Kentron sp. H]
MYADCPAMKDAIACSRLFCMFRWTLSLVVVHGAGFRQSLAGSGAMDGEERSRKTRNRRIVAGIHAKSSILLSQTSGASKPSRFTVVAARLLKPNFSSPRSATELALGRLS